MPKSLSIVIPAHNEERYLPRVLEAIGRQVQRPQQVIVVDNNSTDRTAEIATSFPFVTVLHEPKQGIVYARNRGFAAVTNEIIARIDADSLLPPHWTQTVTNFYDQPQHELSAITGGCYFYNLHSGTPVGRVYDLVVHRLNQALVGYLLPWGSNMALPTALWEKVRTHTCHTTEVHEDLDLGIHLHQAGGQTIYKPRLRVGAVARRIRSERGKLWKYLKMWTHTLQSHHIKTWPLSIPLSMGIWLGSYSIFGLERTVDVVSRHKLQ